MNISNMKPSYDELKARVKQLEKQERYFNHIVQNTTDGILIIQNGKVIFANIRVLQVSGYTLKELKKRPFMDMVFEEDQVTVSERHARRLKGEKVLGSYEFRMITKDQRIKWIRVSARRILWKGRSATLNFLTDVDEKKAYEQQLQVAQFTFDNTRDYVLWTNAESRLVYVNAAACKRYGYSEEEFLKLSVRDIDPMVRTTNFWEGHWQDLITRKTFTVESSHVDKNGQAFFIEVTTNYVKFRGNEYNCAIVRDITERREREIEATRHTKNIEFLLKSAGCLARTGQEENMYRVISDLLHEYTAPHFIQVFSARGNDQSFVLEQIQCPQDLLELASEIHGYPLTGKEFKIDPADLIAQIKTGKLIKVSDGLHPPAESDMTEAVFQAISKQAQVHATFMVGMVYQDHVHGVLILNTVSETDLTNDPTIETFAQQAALAIQKKYTTDLLKASEEQYRLLFASSPNGYALHKMIWDPSGQPYDYLYLQANDNFEKFTGVNPVGKTVRAAFPGIENDPFDWIGKCGHVVKTGEPLNTLQHLPLNNQWYDLLAYRTDQEHFVVVFTNITGQKQQQLELEQKSKEIAENDAQIRSIFQATPIVIGLMSKGFIVEINDRVEQMLGYGKEELIGKSMRDIYSSEEEYNRIDLFNYYGILSGITNEEVNWCTKQGDIKQVLLSTMPVNVNDLDKGITFAAMDISAQKTTERKLLKQNMNLAFLSEASIHLSNMGFDDDIFSTIGQNLKKYNEKHVIYLFRFDPLAHVLIQESVIGDETERNKVEALIRGLFVESVCALNQHSGLFENLATGKLERLPGKSVFASKQEGYSPYMIGFVRQGNIYGGMLVITSQASISFELFALETFAGQVSVSFHRHEIFRQLQEKQELLNLFLGAATDSITIYDQDFNLIETNDAALSMFDASHDKSYYLGKNIQEIMPGTVGHKRAEQFAQVQQTGRPVIVQDHKLLPAIGEKYFTVKIFKVGRGIGNIITDVTRQKEAEKRITESEKKYRELAELIPGVIFETDMLGNFTFVNQQGLQMFEYAREDIEQGINIEQVIAPESREAGLKNFKALLNGEPYKRGNEYLGITKTGIRYPFIIYNDLIVKNGTPAGVRGVLIDITERKKVEDALLESEEKFRLLSEQSLMAIYIVQNNQVIYANHAINELLEYAPQEFMRLSKDELNQLVHPADQETNTTLENEEATGAKVKAKTTYTVRMIAKSGRVKWVDGYARKITYKNNPASFITLTDSTKRMLALESLEKSEQNFRNLVEYSPNGLIIHNRKSILFSNQAALETLGCQTMEELNQVFSFSILDRESKRNLNRIFRDLRKGKKVPFVELTVKRPSDDKPTDIEIKYDLIEYNKTLVYQAVFRDISVQKRLMKEQIRAQVAEETNVRLVQEVAIRKKAERNLLRSLNEKEVLFKEVHHRVKNNMQIISSMLNLQASQIGDQQIRSLFDESQNRIKSMALIHENLYRSQDLTNIDLKRYVEDLISNLIRTYARDGLQVEVVKEIAEIPMDLDTGIPCGLIINELVSNSLKYAFDDIEKGVIFVSITHADESTIRMVVGDDGVGLAREINFNKPGSLGLEIVKALVDQLDGVIETTTQSGTRHSIIFNI